MMKKLITILLAALAIVAVKGQDKESRKQFAEKMTNEICACYSESKNAKYIILDTESEDCFYSAISKFQDELMDILPGNVNLDDTVALQKHLMPILLEVYLNLNKNDCFPEEDTNLIRAYEFYDDWEYEKAIEYFSNVPTHLMGFYERNDLGICYYVLENYEKAIENYLIAMEIRPYSSIIHQNLASAYLKNGDTIKAIQTIEKAVLLNQREDHYQALAADFSEIGDFKNAQKLYEKAIEANPDNIDTYVELADLFVDAYENSDMAIELLEMAYQKDSMNFSITTYLTDLYIKKNNCEKAAQINDHYFSDTTHKYNFYADDIANCFFENGKFEAALQYYQKVDTVISFTASDYYIGVTRCERELGNYSNALKTINNGIAADSLQQYFLERAKTYLAMEQFDTALEDYDFLVKTDPGNCDYYRERIKCLEKINNQELIKRDKDILELLSCEPVADENE